MKGDYLSMQDIYQLPNKVKFIMELKFGIIDQLYPRKVFIGGRVGYSKERIFKWLLIKKVTNWGYRTIAEIAHISTQTLCRRDHQFRVRGVYEKVFQHLVKSALKQGFIKGKKVAMDGSFVATFSKQEELGSLKWNGFKKAYGFKLHALIDCETRFPIALVVTDGLFPEGQIAIPLMKKAKRYLKQHGYVLADKGYDDTDIVAWIVKHLKSKAGIPMRNKSKLAKGKKDRYGNLLNWRLKATGRTFKKSIYKLRTEVERFFSSLKRTYHLGHEATRGIESFTKNAYLALICYALKKLFAVGIRSFQL